MIGTRRSAQASPLSVARLAALAGVLTIFLQAFAVQVHVHALPGASDSQLQAVTSHAEAHIEATGDQVGCVICEALAAGGRILPPQAGALTTPEGATTETAPPAIRAPPRAHSHAWRSRAPPILL